MIEILVIAFVFGIVVLGGIWHFSKDPPEEFTEEMQREEEERWRLKKNGGYTVIELIMTIFGLSILVFILGCVWYVFYLVILALQKYIGG